MRDILEQTNESILSRPTRGPKFERPNPVILGHKNDLKVSTYYGVSGSGGIAGASGLMDTRKSASDGVKEKIV